MNIDNNVCSPDAPGTSQEITVTGKSRRKVYDQIRAAGDRGLTDEECQVALGMAHFAQTLWREELGDWGWVVDSGRTRPTRFLGFQAIVWVALEQGGEIEKLPSEVEFARLLAQVEILVMVQAGRVPWIMLQGLRAELQTIQDTLLRSKAARERAKTEFLKSDG